MITDAIWADLDKDGDQDLAVVGDWMPIKMFENKQGKFAEIKNDLSEFTGFWRGISAADYDKDGDIDFTVGNLGTNTKLRKEENSFLKMWIKDIDNNQTKEHIIAYNRGDKYYPIASKDEMGKQIPSVINKRFTDYKDFAGKTIQEIFEKKELAEADEKLINTYESVYLENLGGNKFKMRPLPSLAQVSKVMTMLASDVNGDGNMDVIMGGNFDGASMYQARYDASFGLILKGDGKGNFLPTLPTDHGFMLEGDIRDIKPIKSNNSQLFLVSRNNDKMQIFRKIK
jgi:enediyne biosynthesis protein E4